MEARYCQFIPVFSTTMALFVPDLVLGVVVVRVDGAGLHHLSVGHATVASLIVASLGPVA
jgi:hypothetical protein